MAWEDRDYNRDGTGGAGDFLANPAGMLGLSVPFGTWLGVRVRLHFWLLLSFLFLVMGLFDGVSPLVVLINMALMVSVLLLHDFGHRAFTLWVGGEHNEFMLWPAGGMVFPNVPPGVRPTLIAYSGGMIVNLILGIGGFIAFQLLTGVSLPHPFIGAVLSLGSTSLAANPHEFGLLPLCVENFTLLNWGLVIVNCLPYFWFDGGFLWRSFLRPMTGAQAAHTITCIFGMILAVPMFFLSLMGRDLLMMIVWVFLFSSAYTARSQMMVETEEYSVSYAGPGPEGRVRTGRWPAKAAAKAQAKRKREEAKIDAILAKVSANGMHSLTWTEKRTLKKGSQRLR